MHCIFSVLISHTDWFPPAIHSADALNAKSRYARMILYFNLRVIGKCLKISRRKKTNCLRNPSRRLCCVVANVACEQQRVRGGRAGTPINKLPCWQWHQLNCSETEHRIKIRISYILTFITRRGWRTTKKSINKNNVRMRQAEQISNTFLGSQIKFSILFAAVAVSLAMPLFCYRRIAAGWCCWEHSSVFGWYEYGISFKL